MVNDPNLVGIFFNKVIEYTMYTKYVRTVDQKMTKCKRYEA